MLLLYHGVYIGNRLHKEKEGKNSHYIGTLCGCKPQRIVPYLSTVTFVNHAAPTCGSGSRIME